MALRPVSNPPNPWQSAHVEWLDEPPRVAVRVFHETARSIVSTNDSPDVGFRHGVNPYRGCQHGCAYCYARPSHQYWDFGAGTDFESRIVVKINAADLLRETFMRRSWAGDVLAFSGNTDCYQPLEASYGITRACLSVCAEFRNPVAVITRSAIIRRDLDLLRSLADYDAARVHISVPFADSALARAIEPSAPTPATRFDTIRALADAGIPVGVAVAPIIPALNDSQAAEILERAADAGATSAFCTLVRLPGPVEDVFVDRLRAAVPDRADHVLSAIRQARGGAMTSSRFGERMQGSDHRWSAFSQLFERQCARLGLRAHDEAMAVGAERPSASPFRRPTDQLDLFESDPSGR